MFAVLPSGSYRGATPLNQYKPGMARMTLWAERVENDSGNLAVRSGDVVFYTDEKEAADGDLCMVEFDESGRSVRRIRRVFFLDGGKVALLTDAGEFPSETVERETISALLPLVHPIPKRRQRRDYGPFAAVRVC